MANQPEGAPDAPEVVVECACGRTWPLPESGESDIPTCGACGASLGDASLAAITRFATIHGRFPPGFTQFDPFLRPDAFRHLARRRRLKRIFRGAIRTGAPLLAGLLLYRVWPGLFDLTRMEFILVGTAFYLASAWLAGRIAGFLHSAVRRMLASAERSNGDQGWARPSRRDLKRWSQPMVFDFGNTIDRHMYDGCTSRSAGDACSCRKRPFSPSGEQCPVVRAWEWLTKCAIERNPSAPWIPDSAPPWKDEG